MRIVMPILCVLACWLLFVDANTSCEGNIDRQDQAKIDAVERMVQNQPYVPLGFSMDRYLLNERLHRFNDPNKMCYLYVVLNDGTWLQVTIVGKLASTSKRLTNPEGYSSFCYPVPDEMGCYGSSDPAHFGMTTLGSLIEVGGFLSYIYSETPLMFKNMNKPMIEMEVKATLEEVAQFTKGLEALKHEARR